MAKKLNIVVRQGETFTKTLFWYSGATVIKAISAISLAYPAVVTSTTHGLPTDPIPVSLIHVPSPLLTDLVVENRILATKISASTFSVDLDTTESDAYASGGSLVYTPPLDITGYTARMKIKDKIGGSVITSLTSGGDIAVGTTDGKIVITITATVTAAITQSRGVYDLEMVSGSVVTRILEGNVRIMPEVTT